jgi:hypothetical protein
VPPGAPAAPAAQSHAAAAQPSGRSWPTAGPACRVGPGGGGGGKHTSTGAHRSHINGFTMVVLTGLKGMARCCYFDATRPSLTPSQVIHKGGRQGQQTHSGASFSSTKILARPLHVFHSFNQPSCPCAWKQGSVRGLSRVKHSITPPPKTHTAHTCSCSDSWRSSSS